MSNERKILVCYVCEALNSSSPEPVILRDSAKRPLCRKHGQGVIALGLVRDRINRNSVSTYQPLADESKWAARRHTLADDPAFWSHNPRQHKQNHPVDPSNWEKDGRR